MKTGGLASEPAAVYPVADSGEGGEFEKGDEGDREVEGEKEEEQDDKDKCDERLYYGLHWRKELNWRALGFEFVEADVAGVAAAAAGGDGDGNGNGERVQFHA